MAGNGYDDKSILRDADGNPIPQIWDDVANDFVPYRIMEYAGKSGDEKPTGAPVGSTYLEIDAVAGALNVYLYDGEEWVMV